MTAYPKASWFETSDIAALLSMGVYDLILGSGQLAARGRRYRAGNALVAEIPL